FLERNTHRSEVVSDAALLSVEIQNIPSDNPKTGRITAQSVIALLRKLRAPLSVGT
ncbi:MAG: aspartate dehydrogenase, partial [Advenella sp.]